MSVCLDFSNKVVVVVGGTSGINRGIAEQFARQGSKVAVASRDQIKVDDTVASLIDLGAAATFGFTCDVRNIEEVAEGLRQVHEAFGNIDILVSGAAGNFPALANSMSANAFKAVVDIDLLGTFHVMKSAYPYLKKPGASVINISAPQSVYPYEAQSHVCAAKSGVDMITRTLAMEWGPDGIRVNSVIPGFIQETEGFQKFLSTPEMLEAALSDVPLQRFGSLSDVADTCLFLGSPLSAYVSGMQIAVDGALYQRGSGLIGKKVGEMARAS